VLPNRKAGQQDPQKAGRQQNLPKKAISELTARVDRVLETKTSGLAFFD
jgi:hypothetical protein